MLIVVNTFLHSITELILHKQQLETVLRFHNNQRLKNRDGSLDGF